MLVYQVIAAGAGIGLLEGSEIAMFILAGAAAYGWRRAWLVLLAGLLSLLPILAGLYFFFTIIPVNTAVLLAGIVIFALGAHFFYEGFTERNADKEHDKEDKKAGAGLLGIYGAVILEEIEAGAIVMSIAVASGGAYGSVILGMFIGLFVPLIAIKGLKSFIEKIPEWIILVLVGLIMMGVSSLILVYHF